MVELEESKAIGDGLSLCRSTPGMHSGADGSKRGTLRTYVFEVVGIEVAAKTKRGAAGSR